MPNLFNHGYALLIGVGQTATPGYALPVTVKDIQAIHAVLTDPELCAYPNNDQHIQLLHDEGATRKAILDGLDWLRVQSAEDAEATVIVYYSGHGAFDQTTDQYYLLQHDFNPADVSNSALSHKDFTQALRQIKAQRLLVIVDSCHAEGMATVRNRKGLPKNFTPTAIPKGIVDDLKQGEGRAIFTSCRGKQQSYIRTDRKMSIYTYHLIEALKGAANQAGDTVVRISNLMNYLNKTVPVSTRNMYGKEQTPFFDHAAEDFAVAALKGGKGLPEARPGTGLQDEQKIVPVALKIAREKLEYLEKTAAAYPELERPFPLTYNLEKARQEVADLEARYG